jgi:putative hydrolase of the HAD superfamily
MLRTPQSSANAIETLFLDAGGVLVFPNWARVADALTRHGVAADAGALALAEPMAKRRLDIGDTVRATTDDQRGWLYFNLVLTEAGIELSRDTDAALEELRVYHAQENLWESVPVDVGPTLTALRELGLRLVVVSNANGRLRHLFDRLGLTASFDVLFDSFEEGVEKPDPRLFHIALERSGGVAQTTLHVGDLYHIDVVGARAAGLSALLLDAANLYEGYDCARIRRISELVDVVSGRIVRHS